MSTNVNDYLKTLSETRGLARYCLDHTDTLQDFTTEEQLQLMAALQVGTAALAAVEKRMRSILIEEFDCSRGKSKTHDTDVFKIESKRPVNVKVNQKIVEGLREELGERFDDLFRLEYKIVSKELKEANHDEVALAKSVLEESEGQVSVKVTRKEDF